MRAGVEMNCGAGLDERESRELVGETGEEGELRRDMRGGKGGGEGGRSLFCAAHSARSLS